MTALLAFDTATEQMSIALEAAGEVRLLDAPGGAKASAALIPAVMALLAEAGIGVADLDALAFGRGPGAFTGLRTACAVAQGLAFGARIPVLPLDTLMAVAEEARQSAFGASAAELEVWVAMDARMNEIYAGRYAWSEGRWSATLAPLLITPEALNQRWRDDPPRVVAGNALGVFGAALRLGDAVRVDAALPCARALLALAQSQWRAGTGLDAALALPLYLRDKVAQTTAEREAARALRDAAAAGAKAYP